MKKQFIYTLFFAFSIAFTGCSEEQIYASWKKKGENFLKNNKEVITTSSGWQYKVLSTGLTSDRPKYGNFVKINYTRGTLKDSMLEDDLEPINSGNEESFYIDGIFSGELNKLTLGEQDALTRMTLGSKWRIYVPQELAYGKDGVNISTDKKKKDYKIKPYSVIIFEVEILSIY